MAQAKFNTVSKSTPQSGLHYEVEEIPQGAQKLAVISRDYLERRLDYAISRLQERVRVSTAKHFSMYQDSAEKNIELLRKQVMEAFKVIGAGGVGSKEQLQRLCHMVEESMQKYKQPDERLHASQRIAQIFLEMEKKAIAHNFELSNLEWKPLEVSKEDEQELKELLAELDILEVQLVVYESLMGQIRQLKDNIDPKELNAENLIKITTMLGVIEDANTLDTFPDAIKTQIQQYLQKILKNLYAVEKLSELLAQMQANCANHQDIAERYEAALAYCQGLVGFRKKSNYRSALERLQTHKEIVDRVVKTVEGVREVLAQVEPGLNGISLQENKALQADLNRVLDYEYEQPAEAIEPQPIQLEDGELERLNGRVAWNSLDHREAAQIARERIIYHNPLIAYLVHNEYWQDLAVVLHKMKLSDFKDCKVSTTCYGSGEPSMFKNKEGFLSAVFPEIQGQNYEFKGRIERGPNLKRFTWKYAHPDQVQAEIKRRMFLGWPLIEELYQAGKFVELTYLLDIVDTMILPELRITGSVYNVNKHSGAPYNDFRKMLSDVFADVYNDEES